MSGFTAGDFLEIPNEQAASDYADPLAVLAQIQQTQRRGGIGQQIFAPPGDPSQIGVSIELFSTAEGAQDWASAPPELPPAMNPTAVNLDSRIGDSSSAVHWKQGAQAGYVVNFSQNTIVYGVGVAAPAGQESLNTAVEIAQRLDQKAIMKSR